MRKLMLTFVLCVIGYAGHSQEVLMDTEDVYDSDIIQPTFNGGGLDKFYQYITSTFDFKKITKPGKMVATFSIDLTGKLTDIRITEFVEPDAAAEYIRVLAESPKWESAKRNGKPFTVKIKFPLVFKK